MKTRIYKQDDLENKLVQEDIKKTLLQGGNVIFPTETVYGIGAYALSEKGIKGIYEVKGRPSDNPLIMHVTSIEDVKKYTKEHMSYVETLMENFWPGPMTLVLKKKDIVPNMITGGLDSVGMRIPGHHIAKKVIEIAGVPICAPSANISGRPSATLFEHVLEDFKDKVDIIIDGGKSEVGLESTVIDVTREFPVILRPGVITKDMIEKLSIEVKENQEIDKSDVPKAPGMKYRHYAPKGQLIIVDGKLEDVISYMNQKIIEHTEKGLKTGIICTEDTKNRFPSAFAISIGNIENEEEIASNLFLTLRHMDKHDIDYIYSISFHQGKYSEAIMNRLMKAANYNVIQLDT